MYHPTLHIFLRHRWSPRVLPGIYFLIGLSICLGITGCRNAIEPDLPSVQGRTLAVEIAPVIVQEQAFAIKTSGRLAAKAEMKLSFKIGGIIAQISADEGDFVRKNQQLARLNLAEIDAQVAQAQSAFEKARRDLTRMETLYRDSVITLTQLQDTRTGYETVEATLEMAQFNRQYAAIHVPHDGRILRRLAEENEMAAAGQPIFIMSASGQGWVVRMGLADRDIVKLGLGDRATVRFDAYPDRYFEGHITEIAEAADPRTGTFEVEVQVPDPEGLLKAGFVARIDLIPQLDAPYRVIPIESLVEGQDLEGVVFALDSTTNRVRRVTFEIAQITDDKIAARSGLEEVTFVVTAGASYLSDGDVVLVVDSQ